MSRSPVRTDKTCLNCSYVVEQRFCPNCGQENTETRKTFHHLFIHFFEDLTHYENAFWKTIRNLITKPGSLTKVYLSGKRMSYLAPVRLYIFISFVTFFLIAVLPENDSTDSKSNVNLVAPKKKGLNYSWQKENDSLSKKLEDSIKKKGDRVSLFGIATVREFDSIQRQEKPEDRLSPWFENQARKAIHVTETNTRKELSKKFKESFAHNFPKVLFIYMPIFAFVLWVFQDKKRWYYFDHGIFTLHYFSFLLLISLIIKTITCVLSFLGDGFLITLIDGLLGFALYIYMFYYFFPAHHRFYGETRGVTIIKGILMFWINSVLAGIIMLLFIIYTFLNIH